jgi:hypothetical protein
MAVCGIDLSAWEHSRRGRVALPRDRRGTFIEHEQAKGRNVGQRAVAA